jgi:hypothetical protein
MAGPILAATGTYIAALQLAVQRRGGVIRCGCPATGLIVADGRVTGVRADDGGTPREFIARRGVILAAGDYASSGDLIAAHKGGRFRAVEGINPHATGDGHRLDAAAGGALVNRDATYGPELRFVAPPGKPFQQLLPNGRLAARVMGAAFRLIAVPTRDEAPAESRPILDSVREQLGFIPNLHRLMALSPAALTGLQGLLSKALDLRTRDAISLAVSHASRR